MDQKMMKILGAIIAGFVVFILILFLISSCSKTNYTPEKLEERMVKIAKDYYANHEDELPSQDKDTRSYALKQMVSDGKIDEPSKLFDNESIKCDGMVTVKNNNGFYVYTPSLSCGDYKTTSLRDKIIENSLTESGVGLYEFGNGYLFKGDVKNNYVSFANKTFRIIKLNDDGTIRLLDNDGLSEVVWDSKYNAATERTDGINDYVVAPDLYANIKIVNDNYYNNNNVWTDENRSYITTQTICIGKRSINDTSKDGSTECSLTLENQLFGPIAVYEYLQASLDNDCNSTNAASCVNYNWYTSIKGSFWTSTASDQKSNYVYAISNLPKTLQCNSFSKLNVAFNLTENVTYVSGDGTIASPYVFK